MSSDTRATPSWQDAEYPWCTHVFFCYASSPTKCNIQPGNRFRLVKRHIAHAGYRGEMTARTKARLSKSMHSGNAYVTTNGAENSLVPHTTPCSLLVYDRIQQIWECIHTLKRRMCSRTEMMLRLLPQLQSCLALLISVTSSPATPKGRRADSFCSSLCWQRSYITIFFRDNDVPHRYRKKSNWMHTFI